MRTEVSEKYAVASSCWLQFKDPDIEEEYLDAINHKNFPKIKLVTPMIIGGCCIGQVLLPSTGLNLLIRIALVFVCVLLRFTPTKYREYAVVGTETFVSTFILIPS